MAILIKGMEMPTRCGECPCAYSTEGAYWDTCQAVDDQNDIEQFWKSGRPDWCPLVEVPDTQMDDGVDLDFESEALEEWTKKVFKAFGARMEE